MKLEKILLSVIFVLAVFIVGTTVIYLTMPHQNQTEQTEERYNQAFVKVNNNVNEEDSATFNDLGSLRIVTLAEKDGEMGSTLLVKPWLSYNRDKEFYEELYKKRRALKKEFEDYFSSQTKKQLTEKGEDMIKAELIIRLNSKLSLGKISKVYFTDYIFFD